MAPHSNQHHLRRAAGTLSCSKTDRCSSRAIAGHCNRCISRDRMEQGRHHSILHSTYLPCRWNGVVDRDCLSSRSCCRTQHCDPDDWASSSWRSQYRSVSTRKWPGARMAPYCPNAVSDMIDRIALSSLLLANFVLPLSWFRMSVRIDSSRSIADQCSSEGPRSSPLLPRSGLRWLGGAYLLSRAVRERCTPASIISRI